MVNKQDGKLELLTDKNSLLLLVDYQPSLFDGIGSDDKTIIKQAAWAAAKAAKILKVPVVLSAIDPKVNGLFIPEITGLFPGQKVFSRPDSSFDAFEDEKTYQAVKKAGRMKLVVSGLLTGRCFAHIALHALKDGYDVFGLMDAAGDSTPAAHKNGIKSMLQAGVVRITLESLIADWMRDWGQSIVSRARPAGIFEIPGQRQNAITDTSLSVVES